MGRSRKPLKVLPSEGSNPSLSAMECPVDGTTLALSERLGVEIDYCPTCRGVWLDRGELDKIIERADDDDDDDRHFPADRGARTEREHRHDRYGKGRRRGFLGELFDFD